MAALGNLSDESTTDILLEKDVDSEQVDRRLGSFFEEDNLSGSGTVIVRSPKETQVYTTFSNLSAKPVSRFTSSEDVSTSGTVVLRTPHDESEAPRSSKSRLGLQEKSSSASFEDSATNLAEAKAALQGGFRRGNARERPVLSKQSKDALETKVKERASNPESYKDSSANSEGQKVPSKPCSLSESEGSARASAATASPALTLLIVPSLKEVSGDFCEGSDVRAPIEALNDLELRKPGSCEVLVGRLPQKLGSCQESSMKELQGLAARSFRKNSEPPVDLEDSKRQPIAQSIETSSLSPLARFLLTRWQSQVYQNQSCLKRELVKD